MNNQDTNWDYKEGDTYFSKRGCPLVTQTLAHGCQLVTVERYCKWYELYLLSPDGTVRPIGFNEFPKECSGFYDHCPVPHDTIELCKSHGWKIDIATYDAIARRYIQDWYNCHTVFTQEFFKLDLERLSIKSCNTYNHWPTMDDLMAVLIPQDLDLID